MIDLLGDDVKEAPISEAKRKPTVKKGYASTPGSGPAGETTAQCAMDAYDMACTAKAALSKLSANTEAQGRVLMGNLSMTQTIATEAQPSSNNQQAFDKWKEDYALTAEPNYSEQTEADCLAAFKAGRASLPAPAQEDAESTRLISVLHEVRNALQFANDTPNGPINDTIWMMHRPETLFDFIDAAIAKEAGK